MNKFSSSEMVLKVPKVSLYRSRFGRWYFLAWGKHGENWFKLLIDAKNLEI